MYRTGPRGWSPAVPRLTSAMRLAPAVLLMALAHPVAGQTRPELSAEATVVMHQASTTPSGRPLGEIKVVRPVLMAIWPIRHGLGVRITVNLEGATMPAGELSPGAWGEGFVDRRHPHTYAHELILEGRRTIGCFGKPGCAIGGFLGKGYVPFGSADPMVRGFVRYPVNHHLAQILERAVVGGQFRVGPATAEAALFNGDEPERPGQWPRIGGRFGDSWAVRLSIRPAVGFEAAGSLATVHSPEHRPGAGADQHKRHIALSYDARAAGGNLRALAEWAETSELDGLFVFGSRLAEAEYQRGRLTCRYRFEDSDRPEEERLTPYRSARPRLENAILGETRWRTHTAGAAVRLGRARTLSAELIVEGTAGRIARRGAGAFDPTTVYGRTSFTVVSTGIRLAWGQTGHRMGSYGAAVPAAGPHH